MVIVMVMELLFVMAKAVKVFLAMAMVKVNDSRVNTHYLHLSAGAEGNLSGYVFRGSAV